MNNHFYAGDNPIMIKEWNDRINIVTLDWLMENYDINFSVYCSSLDKFVCLANMKFNQVNQDCYILKRIRSIFGSVDVIENYPQRTLLGCVKICRKIPNFQLYNLKDLPAYCMGFFYHLGRINRKTWILNCFSQKLFRMLIQKFKNKYPNIYFEGHQTLQKTNLGSPIFEIKVDGTRNSNNLEFVKIWDNWFFLNNFKNVPIHILNAQNLCKRKFIEGVRDSLDTGCTSMIFNDTLSCAQMYYMHLCIADPVMASNNSSDNHSYFLLKIPKGLNNDNQLVVEKTTIYSDYSVKLYKFEYIPNLSHGEFGDRPILVGIGNMVL
jgi:hypothetical protein